MIPQLKISDLFFVFIWLSLALGTISQLINASSSTHSFLFAAMCFFSIVFLGFKLKLRTGKMRSWLLTGSLGLVSAILFAVVSSLVAESTVTALFAVISFFSAIISCVLLFFRFISGDFSSEHNGLTTGHILEYLAPSGCSALYLTCFVRFSAGNNAGPLGTGFILMVMIFVLTGIIALIFYFVDRRLNK